MTFNLQRTSLNQVQTLWIAQPAAAAVMAPQEVASKLPVMPVSGARKPATSSNYSNYSTVSFMILWVCLKIMYHAKKHNLSRKLDGFIH